MLYVKELGLSLEVGASVYLLHFEPLAETYILYTTTCCIHMPNGNVRVRRNLPAPPQSNRHTPSHMTRPRPLLNGVSQVCELRSTKLVFTWYLSFPHSKPLLH